jgi:transposase
MLLAHKGYEASALRDAVSEREARANIPPKANRKDPICFNKHLYKARNSSNASSTKSSTTARS